MSEPLTGPIRLLCRPPWAGAFQLFDAPSVQVSGLDEAIPLPDVGGAPPMHGGPPKPFGAAPPAAGDREPDPGVVVSSAVGGRPGHGAVGGGDVFLAADGSGVVTLHLQLGAGALSLRGRSRAQLILGADSGERLKPEPLASFCAEQSADRRIFVAQVC